MRYLILLLVLAGCTASSATGPLFVKPSEPSIVVYNNDPSVTMFGIKKNYPVPLSINNKDCTLHNDAYVIIHPEEQTVITASQPLTPGTSRIEIDSLSKTKYIHVGYDRDKEQAQRLLGFIGASIAESNSGHTGPFIFTEVNPHQAISDLQGLHQDCQ